MSRSSSRNGSRYRNRRPRSPARRLLDYGLTLVLFGILAFAVARLDQADTRTEQGAARIVDGDSIELDGLRVRLRGIDAPEYRQMCRRDGHDYACGRQSREALLRMTRGRTVLCTGGRNDQYGRLLGDCSADGVELNREMVAQGWALAYGDFEREEAKARAGKLGVWAGEFEKPRQWRDRRGGRTEPVRDNLAATGDRSR